MAMTQMQIVRSLGEAKVWLENEISWGVPVAEPRHLDGRIGERISVKKATIETGSGHVPFNPKILDQVCRVIILRFDTEEMQMRSRWAHP